jgi:hypothetical protein
MCDERLLLGSGIGGLKVRVGSIQASGQLRKQPFNPALPRPSASWLCSEQTVSAMILRSPLTGIRHRLGIDRSAHWRPFAHAFTSKRVTAGTLVAKG